MTSRSYQWPLVVPHCTVVGGFVPLNTANSSVGKIAILLVSSTRCQRFHFRFRKPWNTTIFIGFSFRKKSITVFATKFAAKIVRKILHTFNVEKSWNFVKFYVEISWNSLWKFSHLHSKLSGISSRHSWTLTGRQDSDGPNVHGSHTEFTTEKYSL